MPLSLELEWTLAACSLIALADGVLTSDEAARVLDMVHSHVDPAEQDAWIDDITSQGHMQARLDALAPPPDDSVERILRRAWAIALVDGEGSHSEARVLESIGERLGRARDDVATSRKLWTSEAIETAGHVATFAALLMHRRAAVSPTGDLLGKADRDNFHRLLAALPLSEARRQRLGNLLAAPGSLDDLGHAILWLGPDRREDVLKEIAAYVRTAGAGPLARPLFLALAARMAVREDLAVRHLGP